MYLVGGLENRDQGWDQRFASYRVHDKWIEELTDLPFPFEDGRCLTLQNPINNYDAYTLMCAADDLRNIFIDFCDRSKQKEAVFYKHE